MEAASVVPSRPAPARPEPQPDREGNELIAAAADGQKLSEGEKVDALEWFLSDERDSFTHTLELNVGTPKKAKWIEWEMRPVDLDTLRRIRRQSQGKPGRRGGQPGEVDEVQANLRIVVEGTVSPDLKEIAKRQNLVDPADVLRKKFVFKPGLLGQIAGEIMSISGYDDDDVREVDAAGG